MVVAAGAWQPAPLEPVHNPAQASPFAGTADRSSIRHHERGSPMKNRTREICTSGSVRDEAGQPPHLLGLLDELRDALAHLQHDFSIFDQITLRADWSAPRYDFYL